MSDKITAPEVIEAEQIVKDIAKVEAAFVSLLAQMKQVSTQSGNFKTQKEGNSALTNNIKLEERSAALLKEKARLENSLIRTQAQRTQAQRQSNLNLQQERVNVQVLNREARETAILNSRIVGAYQKLNLERTQASKTLRDLIASEKASTAELKKAQKEFDVLDAKVRKADRAVRDYSKNVGNYGSAFKGLTRTLRGLVGAFGITSGIALFAGVVKDSFRAITEFDSGLLNVSKTTGLTGVELDKLSNSIINLSKELKTVSAVSLLEYATVAGQLGVKGTQDILNFSEALAKLETASDVTGQEGGSNIARLLNLTDGGVQNVKEFGDELVNLGNNFAATESEILSNATAIAQNTGVYKLGRQEVLAYAVATKASGIEAEITGSTIGRTLGLLERAIRTNEGLAQVTQLTGIAQKDLSQAFRESSGDVLVRLIKGLNDVDKAGGSVNEQLEELGITAIRDQRVIGTLATAGYDTLAKSIEDVTSASGSLQKEFDTASTKLVKQVEQMGIAWDNLIFTIENGQGSYSRFFRGISSGVTGYLNELSDVQEAQGKVFNATGAEGSSGFGGFFERQLKAISFGLIDINTEYEDLIENQREFNRFLREIDSDTGLEFLEDEIRTLNNEIENNNDLTDKQKLLYTLQRDAVEELYLANKQAKEELEAEARQIVETTGKFNDFGKKIGVLSNQQLQDFITANKDVASSLDTLNDKLNSQDFKTLDGLNEKLQGLKKLLGETDVESDLFKKLKKEIKEVENEIKKLNGGSSGGTIRKAIIKGSIDAYEDLITKLKKLRDGTALTTEEYKKFDDQIAQTERKIKQLTEGVDALNKVQGNTSGVRVDLGQQLGIVGDQINAPDAAEIEIGISNRKIANAEREAAIIKSIKEGQLADYKGFTEEETQALEKALSFQLELRQRQEDAIADLVIGGLDSIFQARIDNIDEQLDANQEYLDAILNSTLASDEQKAVAQEQANKEEKRLLKERQKREKQAFLVQQGLALAGIAIDLARTIAAINLAAASIDAVTFGIGGSVYRAANIPFAIGTAAAQAGLVLAQSIPQFFKGKTESNQYEGIASVNEKAGQREIRVTKEGGVEVFKPGMQYTMVNASDIITKSFHDFKQGAKNPNSEIHKRITKGHTERVEHKQNAVRSDDRLLREVSMLRKELRGIANRPIDNRISIEQPFTYR